MSNSAQCPTCSDNMQILELSQNAVVWYCYNCQEAKRNVTDPRDTISTDQDTGTPSGHGAWTQHV